MQVIINETILTVNNCYTYRYNNGKLVLKIEVPQTEITHDELKALLKTNAGDIVAIKDDETQTSFSGFTYAVEITDKADIYSCEIECQSEAEYQLGILKTEYKALQSTVATQNAVIDAQAVEIKLLNETLLEQILG